MLLVSLALFAAVLPTRGDDPRTHYDVQTYRLDLRVAPPEKLLSGTAAVEVKVVRDELSELVLDLHSALSVAAVHELAQGFDQESAFIGRTIQHEHGADRLVCKLSRQYGRGELVRVAVEYSGTPLVEDEFTGFHWRETPAGAPWIATSCQGIGAHTWFPCKASYWHPEDKHERAFVNLDVPADLVGVSNGRLVETTPAKDGRRVFRWRSDDGCGTYSVTLNVAPYVVSQSEIPLPGLDRPLTFISYVLPESVEKARVQFAQVPELLNAFSEAFGPFPFPEAKYALVETPFWGMEHSTAIAYGSSFPAWCAQSGAKDPYAARNRWFDYILVHETAHEWWGNSVTARDWGHFWIHEGFGTYAEIVYVEKTQGPEAAERFAAELMKHVPAKGSLYRGENPASGDAYTGLLYGKGASVLHTLRKYVGDDDAWWTTLREFQKEFRHGHAVTEDFRALLEKNTGREWEQFFQEWFYGSGTPELSGTVAIDGDTLTIDVLNSTEDGRSFHVPLEIEFRLNETTTTFSRTMKPGANKESFTLPGRLSDLRLRDRGALLGSYEIEIREGARAR